VYSSLEVLYIPFVKHMYTRDKGTYCASLIASIHLALSSAVLQPIVIASCLFFSPRMNVNPKFCQHRTQHISPRLVSEIVYCLLSYSSQWLDYNRQQNTVHDTWNTVAHRITRICKVIKVILILININLCCRGLHKKMSSVF